MSDRGLRRRAFLQYAGWPAARAFAQTRKPPNFVFVLADDLGWGDLGCYGHRQIQTPSLDGLARQGALFTQFYVNSPVCSPSRTAFMTSHYPARHRIHGHLAVGELNQKRGMPNWLDPGVTTLPHLLKRAGYRTGHFGKWHLGSGPGAPPIDAYGIDNHRTAVSNGPGWPPQPYFWAKSSALIVDEAIRFIEQNRHHPFYVNLWTLLPHATLDPTEEQMEPYRRFGPGNTPHKGALQVYYASVTNLDQEIGRLLNRLDVLELDRDTVVLFSSDNGPEDIHITNASHSGVGTPGPFRGRKRSLYEGGVRVPFMVRWPGHVPAGRVDGRSVLTAVDFLPTLAKLAGVTPPQGVAPDGEDVSDILLGAARPRTKPILWEWRFHIYGDTINRSPMLSIREGDWKLLRNPDGSRVELYNIPNDASELNNLAERHPELVNRLSATLLGWHKTLPPGPVEATAGKNDYPWPGR